MLLWCDGFDHYGLDETNMTDGAYAQVDVNFGLEWTLSTANPRTGTHHLRRDDSATGPRFVRRVLGGAKSTVGQAAAVYFDQLPMANDRYVLYDFRDTANTIQVSVVIQSTGIIEVKRGDRSGTSLGATATPAVVAEAYQHIETLATFDNSTGSVEVRVNGVTVLSISGADTAASLNEESSQVALACGSNSGSADHGVTTDIDDYFCYDDTGSYNNTFIGDRRVLTLFPNADTAQEDWVPSAGSDSFAMVDEADPDDDGTYISAAAGLSPNPVTEFDLSDMPAGVASISAVQLVHRSRKTDAGDANIQLSAVSASSEATGTDRPITEAYTYYHDVVEADPDTSTPFTPSAVDALKLKIERTL